MGLVHLVPPRVLLLVVVVLVGAVLVVTPALSPESCPVRSPQRRSHREWFPDPLGPPESDSWFTGRGWVCPRS